MKSADRFLFRTLLCLVTATAPLSTDAADFTVDDFKHTLREAEAGDLEAHIALGDMYLVGEGVPQNYAEALKWYRRAAEKGNAGAQNNLALMYLKGQGVPRNPIEAARWIQMAARKGLPEAQRNLGILYLEGTGVGRNAPEALKWFRRAAEQGDADGQRTLGEIYAAGQAVRADYIEAYKWFSLAAAQGNGEAQDARDLIGRNLSAQQIAEGQRRAAAFVPRAEPGGAVRAKASGSGFFVTNDGYYITCHHVVDGATRIVIRTRNARFAAELIGADKTNDIALLKVTGALPRSAPTNYPAARPAGPTTAKPATNEPVLLKVVHNFGPLALADSDSVKLGDSVSTLGFPNINVQGREPKLTRGEVNSLSGIRDNPRYFQISAPIQPGNSGGPLLDNFGNVIGIVALRLNDLTHLRRTGVVPQNVNYAVKSRHILELLKSVEGVQGRLKTLKTLEEAPAASDWISGLNESVAVVEAY